MPRTQTLIEETDEQGAPRAWPIARNPRQIIRRTPKGTETRPYVILSSLRLGHPALPGRAALDPTEQLLSPDSPPKIVGMAFVGLQQVWGVNRGVDRALRGVSERIGNG